MPPTPGSKLLTEPDDPSKAASDARANGPVGALSSTCEKKPPANTIEPVGVAASV